MCHDWGRIVIGSWGVEAHTLQETNHQDFKNKKLVIFSRAINEPGRTIVAESHWKIRTADSLQHVLARYINSQGHCPLFLDAFVSILLGRRDKYFS